MNNKILNLVLYNYNLKKKINYLLSKKYLLQNKIYQYFLNKKIKTVINKYKKSPYSLRIENTNICNGQCFMCPYPIMKRKKGIMSKELYKKIINQAVDLNIQYINLHNFGEPLADKDFAWRVKYAKEKGIKRVSTNTNGTLMTQKIAKEIIDSGLDELYISLDASTKKTYQKIRIGLNYDHLLKNIRYFLKLKKQLKLTKPKIILDFLEFDLNKTETTKFINKWKGVVDNVCISQIHDWSNKKEINTGLTIKNYVEYSHSPCRLPFTEMLINWDGTVSLCCQDIEGEVILGDVNKDSISNIWKNKKYQKIRQNHLEINTNNLKLCQNCKLRTFWWTF